jgi:hypothetical protein
MMSYLTHINRHEDDLNFNEDFEESIARNNKEDEDNESEGERNSSLHSFWCFYFHFPLYLINCTLFSVF